jgi:hypothetical protein
VSAQKIEPAGVRHRVHRADLTINLRDAPSLRVTTPTSTVKINPLKMVISAMGAGGMWVEVSGTLRHGRGMRRGIRFNIADTKYRPMPAWVRETVNETLDRHDI